MKTIGFHFKSNRKSLTQKPNEGHDLVKTVVYIREDGVVCIDQRFLLSYLMEGALKLRDFRGYVYQSRVIAFNGSSFYRICSGYQEALDSGFISKELFN